MARRTPGEVFQALTAAGFDQAAATVMTEIAGAESSWDDTAVGDVALESSTWGPSVGVPQIRTLKADTGKGTDRDIVWLQGNLAHQAKAAYDISHQGQNFGPWATYVSGAYRKFAGQVAAAIGVTPATPASSSTGSTTAVDFPTWGPAWLPWNIPGDIANGTASTLGGVRTIALEALAAVAGLTLVGFGAYRLAAPGIRAKADQAAKVARAVV